MEGTAKLQVLDREELLHAGRSAPIIPERLGAHENETCVSTKPQRAHLAEISGLVPGLSGLAVWEDHISLCKQWTWGDPLVVFP